MTEAVCGDAMALSMSIWYQDPPIHIVDEAVSALDDETESELINAIDRLRGNRSSIIAHRASTFRRCDRVVGLRGGRIDGENR